MKAFNKVCHICPSEFKQARFCSYLQFLEKYCAESHFFFISWYSLLNFAALFFFLTTILIFTFLLTQCEGRRRN